MRDFVKEQTGNVLSWSLWTAGQIATLPLRSLPSGALKSVGSALEQQINQSVQTSIQFGDDLQRRVVDLMFDAVTFKPLTDSLRDIGFPTSTTGNGFQVQAELEFMKVVNDTRPGNTGVVIPMIVMFTSLKHYTEGIERLESYLQKFKLTDRQKSVYLAGLALLRSAKAKELPLWQLPEQVRLIQRALAEAREAKELVKNEPDFPKTHHKIFAYWTSGILLSQLPWPFGDPAAALEDLKWCERTAFINTDALENTFLFLRQVYYSRAVLARNAGNQEEARRYLELSGYKDFSPDNLFIASIFAVDSDGVRSVVKQVKENVPGRGFTVSGFDLSDYNFFITDDGKQLLAVDSGSQVALCEAAYRFFEDYYQKKYGKPLPKLTTCFMTHYHWDHTGGYPFFKSLNPEIAFYSRATYTEESERARNQPPPWSWTIGVKFNNTTVVDYQPTITPANDTELTIGGTRVQLLMWPGGGGETPDGMGILLPDHRVLYCGDFIVPWVGSPYVEEGDADALLATMDLVANLEPEPVYLLFGHWAVTQFYPTVDVLKRFRPRLQWLKEETLKMVYGNKSREEIQQANLSPPDLIASGESDVQVPYIAMREVFIDRVFRQKVGYWGPQLQGVDYLNGKDFGVIFSKYLKLSDFDLACAIHNMVNAGDFELAGQLADWAAIQYPGSGRIQEVRKEAFLQLKQKWQLLNVFKFAMYSEHIDDPTPQTSEAPFSST
ncbi:MAG TPA: MBL fold metallo-hydrolase [Candidatus Angelobacter sp.]|jgi:glyoxylase-like metal-dependent hydrolase (beta-lactamase superfamily II)|nr:MBL fold metallo-hydrolase [Candidatus Angelobacter sp.]